jgi:hypothetical protein
MRTLRRNANGLSRLGPGFAVAVSLVLGCTSDTPSPGGVNDHAVAAQSVKDLLDPRVPPASAGDPGWSYQQRVVVDLNADGVTEEAVLISDVTLDARGRPMWEDGHRWQLYVQDRAGDRTRVYARFLPNGKLTASVARSPAGSLTILLLEQTPQSTGLYEIEYRQPQNAFIVSSLVRPIDVAGYFAGSARP